MRKELDEKLVKEFPLLFKDRNAPMTQTAMCWGFDCRDGWYFLIHHLCKSIQGSIDANPHLKLHQPTVFQVKEKFGSLRFYTDAADDETRGMIRFAEHLSAYTCELCGKEGRIIRERGWYLCRCYGCWKTARKEKAMYGDPDESPDFGPSESDDGGAGYPDEDGTSPDTNDD